MRLFVLLFSLLAGGSTFASEPFGRASIMEVEKIVPGQQVHVVVEVFAPDFFTSPPQFPLFDAPDALVTLSNDIAQNMVQRMDGVQYAGIRKSYVVVPEKPGSFALPEIDIDLGYSSNGTSVKSTVKVGLPSFEVSDSPGSNALPFAARNLTITQSFDRDASSLTAGDALVRTIVIFAEDTQAMLIPSVDFAETVGIKQYVKPPVLAEGVERRGIGRSVQSGSTRTQTVVYTTTEVGRFSLPKISYPWFDTENGAVALASLPAVDLVVARDTSANEDIAPTSEEDSAVSERVTWRKWGPALLVLALGLTAFVSIRRNSQSIRAWARRIKNKRRNSPKRRLKRLRATIADGGEFAIYRTLQDWSVDLSYPTVAAWVEAQQNTSLTEQVAILERRLFRSQDVELDRKALSLAIAIPKRRTIVTKSELPELNPTTRSSLLPPL
ncbi:hypothetical protein GAO09_09000 [Rhizobiales bacterium RZME27]|uniref:Protein BatD n=1 Tax=Endobacterium cereale TaxID=2663029 RepID=A0A6A8AAB1_9HYPH|nr:BatD family protein [Endobacterium cereale]MQY46186.1 hypothetical protein [Endobacterium cereale]